MDHQRDLRKNPEVLARQIELQEVPVVVQVNLFQIETRHHQLQMLFLAHLPLNRDESPGEPIQTSLQMRSMIFDLQPVFRSARKYPKR